MEAVEHVQHLIRFTVAGLICLLALKICDADTVNDIPPDTDIHNLAKQIVQCISPTMDKSLQEVTTDEHEEHEPDTAYCSCMIDEYDERKFNFCL